MRKKKKKSTSVVVKILVLLLILGAGYFLYDRITDRTDYPGLPDSLIPSDPETPLTHTGDIQPAAGFIHDGEPVIQLITRWQQEEQLSLAGINRRLPDSFEVLILDEDINANGQSNFLIINRDDNLPTLSSFLSDAGFSHVFRDLAVYEVQNRELIPLLTIDHHAIRNRDGVQLIDQVAALNGYALLLETYENVNLYDSPVRLIEIVMVDDEGREISDEIVIYWNPTESTFKATNTFGAP